ncbi:MAG: cytochrome c oxidase assembly protein [Chloroflexota bacterium]
MGSILAGLFSFQYWQAPTFILVGTAVFLFIKGRRYLAQTGYQLERYRQPAFFAGMGLVLLILGSPVHHLATQMFSVHVAQHILLMALIPCLINLSNPLPILWAALPGGLQTAVKQQFFRPNLASLRAGLHQVTNPGSAFVLATVTFWIWYDPKIHQLTRQYRWVHSLETTLLLFVALLYWWHILGSSPQIHRRMPPVVRILYTVMGTWPIKVVGLILLFSSQNLYQYPDAYQFSGLNINDQGVGAILVWALGGVVFSSTATILARDWLHHEEMKPINPAPAWQNDYEMRAPGFPSPRP